MKKIKGGLSAAAVVLLSIGFGLVGPIFFVVGTQTGLIDSLREAYFEKSFERLHEKRSQIPTFDDDGFDVGMRHISWDEMDAATSAMQEYTRTHLQDPVVPELSDDQAAIRDMVQAGSSWVMGEAAEGFGSEDGSFPWEGRDGE